MRKVGTFVIFSLLLLFAILAYRFISYREAYAVSDAAFIRSDSLLTLAFKVGGKVVKLTKIGGDKVAKGELLALIDPHDFKVALQGVEAKIAALRKKKEALSIERRSKESQLKKGIGVIENDYRKLLLSLQAKRFALDAKKALVAKLERDFERYKRLYQGKLIQKEQFEKIKTEYESQKDLALAMQKEIAASKVDLKNLTLKKEITQAKLEGLRALEKEIDSLTKTIASLEAKKQELQDKIAYCTLTSPITGVVAKRFIAIDRVVKKGSPIYSLVNLKDIHIEVLLSEKKLEGVDVGSDVKITVDAFKDREYKGKVSKILPASAATFALVPRDIASGEFTKLDQRFVVRISIENPTPDLRVGMGASVAIRRK